MKEFTINEGSNNFIMKLPTSLKEITAEYLNEVTEHIHIAPFHAIVACVYRGKLPVIISASKKSRELSTTIVPLFVRANVSEEVGPKTVELFNNIKTSDKIIIAGTDIERGYQLTCPRNLITVDTVVSIYNTNTSFSKGVMADQNYYYFVDFKLVPINDIKGYYNNPNVANYNNPFVTKIEEGSIVDVENVN